MSAVAPQRHCASTKCLQSTRSRGRNVLVRRQRIFSRLRAIACANLLVVVGTGIPGSYSTSVVKVGGRPRSGDAQNSTATPGPQIDRRRSSQQQEQLPCGVCLLKKAGWGINDSSGRWKLLLCYVCKDMLVQKQRQASDEKSGWVLPDGGGGGGHGVGDASWLHGSTEPIRLHKRCRVCSRWASWGVPPHSKVHCPMHKRPFEINLSRVICSDPSCNVQASYGLRGTGARHCKTHAQAGEIMLKRAASATSRAHALPNISREEKFSRASFPQAGKDVKELQNATSCKADPESTVTVVE